MKIKKIYAFILSLSTFLAYFLHSANLETSRSQVLQLIAQSNARNEKMLSEMPKSAFQSSQKDSSISVSIQNNPQNENLLNTSTSIVSKPGTKNSDSQDIQAAPQSHSKNPYDKTVSNIAIIGLPVGLLGVMLSGGAPIALLASAAALKTAATTGILLIANNMPHSNFDQKSNLKNRA